MNKMLMMAAIGFSLASAMGAAQNNVGGDARAG